MYGWRCRIGLIVPSSNTVMEVEFSRFCSEEISLHVARMPIKNVNVKELIQMEKEASKGAEMLKDARVDIIVFGCTSGSLIEGEGYDIAIQKKLEEKTGIPVITTSTAVVEALKAKKMTKIVVATPYTQEINDREKNFLIKSNFEVENIKGLNILDNIKIGALWHNAAYQLGRELLNDYPESDGLFISCTNFKTFEVISKLSKDFQKPVVTSNQATLWNIFKKSNISEEELSSIW